MAAAGKKRNRVKQEGELRLAVKSHPKLGIISTILGLISLIAFGSACFFSGTRGGNAGIMIGLVGMLCFVISVVGFLCAWISLHQEDIHFTFPTIGSVINGIQVLGYMLLYIMGTFL